MLTGSIKSKLIVFVAVALVATSYLGATYVGINPFSSSYRVTVELPQGGGAFTNGEVTYLGVPVGRIKDLTATDEGAEAVLQINGDAPPIPSDVTATVTNRSAIGEQYIDLRGAGRSSEDLQAGDVIKASSKAVPPPIENLLRTGRDFAASVPEEDLKTVIDEAYELSRGAGEHLGQLIDTSREFVEVADQNFLVTQGLIENSDRVLSTQIESAESIKSFSADLDLFSAALRDSDTDLRTLIENSPVAAQEMHRLFDQVGTPLGTLMANLVTPAQIFGINSAGVEDALIRAPEALSVGWAINGSQGLNLGLAQTYFDPLPCVAGYSGTDQRSGLDTSPGRPFNTAAGCTADPNSGTNVRGPGSIAGGLPAAAANVSSAQGLGDLLGGVG
ncbi:MCE family protein [Aeromicrobium sp. YIM 150415]|uniref:MlaD family protein n=1 Tax=Aeromicrobium sp. YIM 150415 TaxID=2803912 RepID=UPI001964B0FB|nr:MlaD family protein [Aeromicrobium sp. YIM 150415]MBM9462357.1 MCE family protein [Aeromicrobium sp. YIM 150415]